MSLLETFSRFLFLRYSFTQIVVGYLNSFVNEMKSVKGDRQSDRQTKPVIEVLATPGRGSDRPQEIKYTDTKIIGNGSFGVVYQAVMINQDNTDEVIAIKKVENIIRIIHARSL